MQDNRFEKEISINAKLGYKLFVPKDYNSSQEWPLLLFLHGIKKRGNDFSLLNRYGLLKHAEENIDFPFLVVAPQCPSFANWPVVRNEVIGLLRHILSSYQVDKKRVYVTGFSMGGHGVWDLAVWYPELFAAAVPIAGWFEKEAAKEINVPIWAFHGEQDDTVAVSRDLWT